MFLCPVWGPAKIQHAGALCRRQKQRKTCVSDAGLKVTGGKMTPAGRLGAFITKVKRGSIADVVGQLKSGLHLTSTRISL